MPRDFREFLNSQQQNFNQTDNKKEDDKTKEYEDILNKYKDMNQNELMSNLFKEANKLKQEGKLDANSLSTLKTTLSPYLNDDQKNMLNSIIDSIK